MATIPNNVQDIITRYLTALKEHGLHIEEAFLFGSHVTGKANQWSDIDLALVSQTFEGVRFTDKSKIRHITIAISSDLEILPFNPRDFTPNDPLVKEILATGVSVLPYAD